MILKLSADMCLMFTFFHKKQDKLSHPGESPLTRLKGLEVPFDDGREDVLHCLLIKHLDGNHIEVTQEARRHSVTAATCRR